MKLFIVLFLFVMSSNLLFAKKRFNKELIYSKFYQLFIANYQLQNKDDLAKLQEIRAKIHSIIGKGSSILGNACTYYEQGRHNDCSQEGNSSTSFNVYNLFENHNDIRVISTIEKACDILFYPENGNNFRATKNLFMLVNLKYEKAPSLKQIEHLHPYLYPTIGFYKKVGFYKRLLGEENKSWEFVLKMICTDPDFLEF